MRCRHSSLIERTKRSACALEFGGAIWRLDNSQLRLRQLVPDRATPLSIAIAEEHPVVGECPVVGEDQRAGNLVHEQGIGMPRGAENLDAARGQIDDEERVVGHQALCRPHLHRKEIRTGDRALVRLQKRLPGGGALGDRREAVRFQDPSNRRAAHAVPDDF